DTLGNSIYNSDDASLPNFDVWGAQTYNGANLETGYFEKFAAKSSKPIWIAETGADAYDMVKGEENETKQAEFLGALWTQIDGNLSAKSVNNQCLGVTFFSWEDGWYKYNGGKHDVHETNASWSSGNYYDAAAGQNMNEEWWGIAAIFPGTYAKRLRKGYYTLQGMWTTDQERNTVDNVLFRRMSVNVPNPFNLTTQEYTKLWFYVKQPTVFNIRIFDYSGKLIRELSDAQENPGYVYELNWDGKDNNNNQVRTGVYICKVRGEFKIKDSSQQEIQYIKIAVVK
ncbi:MAG: hypothetical protein KKH98_11035, partial [Spirochaetes bacterium]|nr:hypothetical protein [Spirochaetota bacterium]